MQSLKPDFSRAKPASNPEWFEGKVVMQSFISSENGNDLDVAAVWFKNGARTKPHLHSTDQLLVVVEGRAVVATENEKIEIGKGQSAYIPSGKWHWHGSATKEIMGHLSIRKPGPTNWHQPLRNFSAWQPK